LTDVLLMVSIAGATPEMLFDVAMSVWISKSPYVVLIVMTCLLLDVFEIRSGSDTPKVNVLAAKPDSLRVTVNVARAGEAEQSRAPTTTAARTAHLSGNFGILESFSLEERLMSVRTSVQTGGGCRNVRAS
jgi:hypothetical protein